MAEKERPKENEEEQAAAPKAKTALFSPIGLIIVVIILVIEGILVYFVATFLQQTPTEVEVADISAVISVPLGELDLVFYGKNGTGEVETMKFDVVLILANTTTPQLKTNLESRKSQFQNIVLDLAYRMGYDTLKRPNSLDDLKRAIRENLNKVLGRDIITEVTFPHYTPMGPS